NYREVLQIVRAGIRIAQVVRRWAVDGPQIDPQTNVRKDGIAEYGGDRVGLQEHARVATAGDYVSGPGRRATNEVVRRRTTLFPADAVAAVAEHGNAVALCSNKVPLDGDAAQ